MIRHERDIRLSRAALYLAILVAWEVLPRVGAIPRLFVPPLSEALGALVEGRREYLGSLPTTLGEILAAYAIACVGGILVGQLIGASPTARRTLLPVIRGVYAVPLVVLYPVMMVWFGLGPESKIAFASIYAFIPTDARGEHRMDCRRSPNGIAEAAARSVRISLQSLPIAAQDELDGALAAARREKAQGLVLLSSPLIFLLRQRIVELSSRTGYPPSASSRCSPGSGSSWRMARTSSIRVGSTSAVAPPGPARSTSTSNTPIADRPGSRALSRGRRTRRPRADPRLGDPTRRQSSSPASRRRSSACERGVRPIRDR
jgi:hypothetical protein